MSKATRKINDLELSPSIPAARQYPPFGDAGVKVDVNEAAVNVQMNNKPHRRTTFVDAAVLADGETYGLTIDGTSNTKTAGTSVTEADVLTLAREIALNSSSAVWAELEDEDGDGNADRLRIEETWAKFTPSTVADGTVYSFDIQYLEGRVFKTETVSYKSTASGTPTSVTTIVQGLRDALNDSDLPVRAKTGDKSGNGNDDILGVEPSSPQYIEFLTGGNITNYVGSFPYTYTVRPNLDISDNSTGASADLTVRQEATTVTFTTWVRDDAGDWEAVRGAAGLQKNGNWTEVFGSLYGYDRIYIQVTDSDGRVGLSISEAAG